MPCSRCGSSSRAPRPAPIPSVVGRPGAGSVNPPVRSGSGLPNNVIKSAITGLRYVPTSNR